MQLKAENIGFRFGNGPWLFRKLYFEINAGEVVGLMGASGRGKTTLSKILAGYLKPLEGEVSLNDEPILTKGRNPIQLIFQQPEKSLNPKWKMSKVLKEAEMLDREILKVLSIETAWLTRRASELSGGELQRFCIARSLHRQTKFLIADEITTMLDGLTQAQIWQGLLRIVQKREMGILVVSHDEDLIKRVAQRIIKL